MRTRTCLLLFLAFSILPGIGKPLKMKEVRELAAKIDQLLEADLKEAKLSPNQLVTDEVFLPLAKDKDGLFTLARAMLTSKRFLFVQ